MTAPSLSLTHQMLRRRRVMGAPVAHGASDHLKRSIGTFRVQLIGDLERRGLGPTAGQISAAVDTSLAPEAVVAGPVNLPVRYRPSASSILCSLNA
jgi:basic amino acid/polyamine antiporter, APA family